MSKVSSLSHCFRVSMIYHESEVQSYICVSRWESESLNVIYCSLMSSSENITAFIHLYRILFYSINTLCVLSLAFVPKSTASTPYRSPVQGNIIPQRKYECPNWQWRETGSGPKGRRGSSTMNLVSQSQRETVFKSPKSSRSVRSSSIAAAMS